MEQLPLSLDSPLTGKVKNDRTMMVFNFFALTKERQTELPVYDDGHVRIEVTGTKHGVATIWDKELLIYIASLMQEKMNQGEAPGQRFAFTAHDFFRITGARADGRAYDRLEESLKRLQGTQIRTNIETAGEGESGYFSWLENAKIQYRRVEAGKIMRSVEVQICDWLYRAILKGGQMLTYHPAYFELAPLERRLYEIARAFCGREGAFKIGLAKLHRRVGTDTDLRHFKSRLVAVSKKKNALPEYGLSVIDPRRYGLDPKAPPPPGRTPLKQYMVFFFRSDNLARMTPPSQAPELPEHEL